MKTQTISLHSYSDPGHGWLKVPIKLLEQLQIADQISQYSYVRGEFAYLEEDGDASLFSKAIEDAGITIKQTSHTCNKLSAIRNYARYTPQNLINQRRVNRLGMLVVYGVEFYTLNEDLGGGDWRVTNRYGATYRMTANQLRAATEVIPQERLLQGA